MAAPGGKFFIDATLDTPAAHHESFAQLWATKWKAPAEMGVYPFMFGSAADFAPALASLTAAGAREPYDWDAYAAAFFPAAEQLQARAEAAQAAGHTDEASEFIPVYHLVPDTATPEAPAPTLVIFTGLDGYRTELAVWMEGWRRVGVATVVLEIPGTGDCPADASDPRSADRLYSSLFAWMDGQARLDAARTAVWGFSTGGFYAMRVAHTHAGRLAGVVALGGGCHHMFDERWLSSVNHLEYPFDLADTLAWKWGYGGDVAGFKREAQGKFSLLADGTLDMPECARLLLVNGTEDEVFPIDDYYLALQHGAPKEARFVAGTKHMGEPASFFVCIKWLYKLFGIEADVVAQLQTLPFKAKY
ncbi:Alpha/Beta hydrolase protein [Boeremia exigua]|uniref:Alpha/Beta hydrolase protein n=1 Tax=Boeremia exigua TaxID=749465 RepID=UPI001E8D86BF|nr:Alpha/Beta hydrolase protein [Boeremia exigua]KAH6643672.1 Alpha/Beta hydrolase protein [Boeremia exigua]